MRRYPRSSAESRQNAGMLVKILYTTICGTQINEIQAVPTGSCHTCSGTRHPAA